MVLRQVGLVAAVSPRLGRLRGVMLGLCRGIVQTVQALRSVDPEIVQAHVDATDLYTAASPELEDEAQHRQEIVFLALDLIAGRIAPGHALYKWLLARGCEPRRNLTGFRRTRSNSI